MGCDWFNNLVRKSFRIHYDACSPFFIHALIVTGLALFIFLCSYLWKFSAICS